MSDEAATENRLWITEGGGVAMSVSGHVIVQSIAKWHSLRAENAKMRDILASIKWRSCEKDNMEFSAKITCFQKDKIDAVLQKDEGE